MRSRLYDVRMALRRVIARVVAEVRYRVPLIVVPMLGGLGSGFTASARHSELVDPYRSGLPRTASCATP